MGSSWMAESAAEELRALEAEHPHRFGLLKLELRALMRDSGRRSSPSVPFTGPPWAVERAVEELRAALETAHPNRNGRLNSRPSLLPTEASSPPCPCFPSTCSAATQESSNLKRKRKGPVNRRVAAAVDPAGQNPEEEEATRRRAARSGVDVALERAELCLRKIRRVKEMLAHG